jgi:hypothetical protein
MLQSEFDQPVVPEDLVRGEKRMVAETLDPELEDSLLAHSSDLS